MRASPRLAADKWATPYSAIGSRRAPRRLHVHAMTDNVMHRGEHPTFGMAERVTAA